MESTVKALQEKNELQSKYIDWLISQVVQRDLTLDMVKTGIQKFVDAPLKRAKKAKDRGEEGEGTIRKPIRGHEWPGEFREGKYHCPKCGQFSSKLKGSAFTHYNHCRK